MLFKQNDRNWFLKEATVVGLIIIPFLVYLTVTWVSPAISTWSQAASATVPRPSKSSPDLSQVKPGTVLTELFTPKSYESWQARPVNIHLNRWLQENQDKVVILSQVPSGEEEVAGYGQPILVTYRVK